MAAPAFAVRPQFLLQTAGHPIVRQASEVAGQAFTALSSVAIRALEAAKTSVETQRPWPELHDRFSTPRDFVEATSRIRKNTSYFFSNYVAILFVLWVICLVFKPKAIPWILVLTLGGVFLFARPTEEPLVILGRAFSSVDLAWIYAVIIILVCAVTPLGAVITTVIIFWLVIVLTHSAYREPDESFPDDGSHPFLTWLGGPNNMHHYGPVGGTATL